MNEMSVYLYDLPCFYEYITRLLDENGKSLVLQKSVYLLDIMIKQYTFNESSSISVERAKALINSAYFTIGVYLKALQSDDKALKALLDNDFYKLVLAGRKIIKGKCEKSQKLYNSLRKNFFETGNYTLNSTVNGGLSAFFKYYDFRYGADDKIITADYPVVFYPSKYQGIEFIEKYVFSLAVENAFLCRFEKNRVQTLLYCVDKHYKDAVFNVFEPVFICCLANIASGKNPYELSLKKEIASGFLKYINKNPNCAKLCEKLFLLLKIQNFAIKRYLLNCAEDIFKQIIASYKNNTPNYFLSFFKET